jgi:hypothetical protein
MTNEKNMEADAKKVIKTFDSCKTYDQYTVATRMMYNLFDMYGNDISPLEPVIYVAELNCSTRVMGKNQ